MTDKATALLGASFSGRCAIDALCVHAIREERGGKSLRNVAREFRQHNQLLVQNCFSDTPTGATKEGGERRENVFLQEDGRAGAG